MPGTPSPNIRLPVRHATPVSDIASSGQVYKRPHLDSFLQTCMDKFHLAVWSSAMAHNVQVCFHLRRTSCGNGYSCAASVYAYIAAIYGRYLCFWVQGMVKSLFGEEYDKVLEAVMDRSDCTSAFTFEVAAVIFGTINLLRAHTVAAHLIRAQSCFCLNCHHALLPQR